MSEVISTGLDLCLTTAIGLVLYVLPGWGLIQWIWRPSMLSWGEQLGLAASLSLALYPVLTLWSYLIGWQAGPLITWSLGAMGLLSGLWLLIRRPPRWPGARAWFTWQHAADLIYLALIALLIVTRLWPIRTMAAPAWGDSVHHTLIVQLILDHGGLFQSWEPYAPIATFSYHFGLHAALASWAWLSGAEAAQAVLVGGQVINVLAVLALYPLAVRLADGNRWAGIGAVLIAGFLAQMPAYYVNWGRYTQLAGQALLPGLLWAFDVWWTQEKRPALRLLLGLVILGTGLLLTHYRIAAIAAGAGLAWTLWALWQHRHHVREWFHRTLWGAGAAAVIGLLSLPWLMIMRSSRLTYVAGVVAERGRDLEASGRDLIAWGAVDAYYTRLLWVGAVVALLWALIRKPKVAVVLLLWSLTTFLLTNPYLLRWPGSGLVSNFTLVIGVYIPLALALGWGLGAISTWLSALTLGRFCICVSLIVLTVYGVDQQLQIVDPFFQLVTPADQETMTWIDQHIPSDATFLVNGFLAYADTVAVGSDAGWWLPYYTRRKNTVPPIVYTIERLEPGVDRQAYRQLVLDLRASEGEPGRLRRVLCRNAITHVYLGDRQGQVGYGAEALIPEAWLTGNADFQLLYRQDQAQVWAFAPAGCPAADN